MIETNNPFDQLAAEYDVYRSGYSRALYDVLEEYGFKPGWSVLDVACGTGLASEPLAKRGLKITGVDISEAMLDKARIRLKEARLVVGDAEKLPFGDGSFNGVYARKRFTGWISPQRSPRWRALPTRRRPCRDLGEEDGDGRTAARAARRMQPKPSVSTPPEDIHAKGFRAFYQYPFKQHHLRVVPHVIMTDVDKWLGYERTRARKSHYGAKFDAYLEALEKIMREMANGKPFQVRYSQFLYIGEV